MNIEERIINVIKSNIERNVKIDINTRLIEDLNIDSFDKIMIISGLEEEFLIEIDVDDFSNYKNVAQIVDKFEKEFGGEE
ncbi:MAG: acyl carrier protein [Clostridiales bacterium]